MKTRVRIKRSFPIEVAARSARTHSTYRFRPPGTITPTKLDNLANIYMALWSADPQPDASSHSLAHSLTNTFPKFRGLQMTSHLKTVSPNNAISIARRCSLRGASQSEAAHVRKRTEKTFLFLKPRPAIDDCSGGKRSGPATAMVVSHAGIRDGSFIPPHHF